MIHLLDTNVVAELTPPRPSRTVVAWARSVPAPDLYLSVVTLAEIELGIAAVPDPNPDRRAIFERALAGIRHEYKDRIAEIGKAEALAYLAIHKRLKSAGTPIDPPDALIAATALANGWTLATRNVKHLARTEALVINPWDHE